MSSFKLMLTFLMLYLSALSWCSNNWLMIWIYMELIFILYLGFISSEYLLSYNLSEFMMKYYIVQVFFSLMLSFMMLFSTFIMMNLVALGVMLILLIKMGVFPFHSWLMSIIGKLSWMSYYILLVVLKLIPLIFMYYSFEGILYLVVVIINSLGGSLLGINNLFVQKLLSYSSMLNLSWMLVSMMLSLLLFYNFFLSYMIMMLFLCLYLHEFKVFYINQLKSSYKDFMSKFFVLYMILSLVGFPPFLGFMIKWTVIKIGFIMNFNFMFFMILIFTVLLMIYYLQMVYYFFIIYSMKTKWYSMSLELNFMGWVLFISLTFMMVMYLLY